MIPLWHITGRFRCLLQYQGDAAHIRNSTDTPNITHCCIMGASTLIQAFFEVKVPCVTKLMMETC